jgi:hypothetical protein
MNTQSTLDLVKQALAAPLPDAIAKAFTQPGSATTGLQTYNLEAPAKTLYPVLTPLRNKIARVTGQGAIQANWKAITGINTAGTGPGLAEGARGGVITTTTADYFAAFRGLGLEDYVSFEADFAALGFEDLKARAVVGLLRSLMIGEEFTDIGGNQSIALGTTPTPTLAGSTTGGTLAAQTWSVICVALTHKGYYDLAGANNGSAGQTFLATTATVKQTVSRTNADGTTTNVSGYSAQESAAATVVTTGATSSIGASVTAVNGAVGYAWFWGASGSERLGAVTTINSVSITAATGGSNQLASSLTAADTSTDSLIYDGILSQILKSGSGAYVARLATGTPGTGTKLTNNGAAGITEFDAAFQSFWNNYRLSPDIIYVNAQEQNSINKLIINNGGAPLVRIVADATTTNDSFSGGAIVRSLLNPITGQTVSIQTHPNIPPGTVMFWSDNLSYSLSGVGNVVQKLLRRDYYQIEWPLRTRKYEYFVGFDGVLQNYFPPAFGVIQNIAP